MADDPAEPTEMAGPPATADSGEPGRPPVPGEFDAHHLHQQLHRLERRLEPLIAAAEATGRGAVHGVSRVVPAWRRVTIGELRWPVSVVIALMIAMQLALPQRLSLTGRWLLPALELLLGAVLMISNPRRLTSRSPMLRVIGLALIGVASLANGWSAASLVRGLVMGTEGSDPVALLSTGGNIWLTNIIIFGLWYWELDRGGPAARALAVKSHPDFLFPQMSEPELADPDWEPLFLDYLYVAFTNATAFSPTDTLPLSRWSKLTMMLQSTISVVTGALVVARAVNILK